MPKPISDARRAGTPGVLIVLRIVLGIGESVYLPAGMKIVSLFFGAGDRGLASGVLLAGLPPTDGSSGSKGNLSVR